MPTAFISITALDGSTVEVGAASVWRVTHGASDGAGNYHTRVDFDGVQETDEAAAKVVADLAAAKVPMIHLTTPAGTAVFLNPSAVTAVAAALEDVDAPGARCAITVSGHRQAVAESPAEVEAALGAVG